MLESDRKALAARLSRGAAGDTAKLAYLGAHALGNDQVHRWELGNGLKVLLLVDRSAPVASYFTWFSVGSRHEKQGKTGLAHFFEHLMFNEVEGRPAGDFDRKLEENGAESNAATYVDWTYYYESLPADRIELAVELEAERMAKLVLREPQVASEREVVSNERRYRVEDDVEGASNEVLYKTAFTRHPYHWPVLGWMDDIQGYTPADCEAFYRTYYAPNNAAVIIVGDVDEEKILASVQRAYGGLARSTIPEEDTHPEPPQLEERVVVLRKPTATEKLLVAYHGPALGDADHAPLTVLDQLLTGGRASRLHRALVIDTELATEARGGLSPFRDPGLYELYAAARGAHTTEEMQRVIDEELLRLSTDLVTDDELSRAKARLELGLLQSLETTSGKAEHIGFYETVLGDPEAGFRRLAAFRRTTAGDVRRVARRYLVSSSRTMVRVLPESTS
jgi:zinc protease